ncbi:apoptosis-inducing factor 3-like isoform X2 [Paramacrobiotus metropolitanus]|uniref:apoptosis-inducing factor 3-like isoform X2 n=1 Tax=Paramacrobiotus metropolitanus TaxID=2943436 RepID=UPI002445C9AB|nr:apoptosis-inducing factor 3-like isoform X2 [Paramacrobiotus metropolitanus]
MGSAPSKQMRGPQDLAEIEERRMEAKQISRRLDEAYMRMRKTDDMFELLVCKHGDLKHGEIRELTIENAKLLLIRDADQYFIVGNKCSHYNAPLRKGSYFNGRLRCPWHGACFNLVTGEIEEYPGIDGIPAFPVKVVKGNVIVDVDRRLLGKAKVIPAMARADKANETIFVIVGGGPAALVAAETLRRKNFRGRVVIFAKEQLPPYDRPKLSKMLDVDADLLLLRDHAHFKKYDIELMLDQEIVNVDTNDRTVTAKTKLMLRYDKLLICTGASSPKRLDVPGNNLKNICFLRTPEEANHICATGKDKNLVIVGASFLALEVAAFMGYKARSVTIICRRMYPFENLLGRHIGKLLRQMLVDRGVTFHEASNVEGFEGTDAVHSVSLRNYKKSEALSVPADLVLVAIGTVPNTKCLVHSGIELDDEGFINVDQFMRTSVERVFAAGDCSTFPLSDSGLRAKVQHWAMAHSQGRIAALNMMSSGHLEPLRSVPYFWTTIFGKSIRYAGYCDNFDDVMISGDIENGRWVAFYLKKDDVKAVATMNYDGVTSQFADLQMAGKFTTRADLLYDITKILALYNNIALVEVNYIWAESKLPYSKPTDDTQLCSFARLI